MKNKLFLLCPFSCMENFIRNKYGDDVFFITAIGTIFQFQETEYLESIKDFINRENITEIFVVSDTSCRFINNALTNENNTGGYSETVIKNLLKDNYAFVMKEKTVEQQQIKLAELIVNYQAAELKKPNCLQQQIIQNKILIRELVTSKKANQIIQLTLKQ
ncbi:MAG TPA: carbonic anhydrase [Ignavibacteriaceae bacterium]|nr:carbonic anhydrase [Ignavibacteriaceae bacterium]